MLHYLTSPNDINVIYLIHMEREGTLVNKRSTACYGVNLVRFKPEDVKVFSLFIR